MQKMKKIIKKYLLYMLVVALPAPLFAEIKDGSVLTGVTLAGYSYGSDYHRFAKSDDYIFGLRAEYLPLVIGGFGLGLGPEVNFGFGDVNINPLMMANTYWHLNAKSMFDYYLKIGGGVTRISQLDNLTDPDGVSRQYTVAKGFLQMQAGLGANIWIKKVAVFFEGDVSFFDRTFYYAQFGVNYKLRSPTFKKKDKKD